MKKCIKIGTIIGFCVIAFIIGVYIIFMCSKIGNSTQEQGFEIFYSYSFTSGDYRDTIISAIVNERNYDTNTMFAEIKDFHNTLNGEPDELTIRLYNSRNDCKLGNCVNSQVYYKK